jgi:hypothetical protein
MTCRHIMSSTSRCNGGSKPKSFRRSSTTSEPCCESPTVEKKCRRQQSSIAGHCSRQSRAVDAPVATAPNDVKAIKFISRSTRLDVPIPLLSARLRAITGNPGRSPLLVIRYSDVKERRGNTHLKLIPRSRHDCARSLRAVINYVAVLQRLTSANCYRRKWPKSSLEIKRSNRLPINLKSPPLMDGCIKRKALRPRKMASDQ